jgi:hypothetical protein
MRRYQGFIADSDRWNRFKQRDDDVVITTPSKSGTTWMQTIVGMLLRQSTDLPPISTIAPWVDMQIRSEEEAFAMLDEQTGRRFMKTHTPFDGLPYNPKVTYIAVIRHPLDVALSDRDHGRNQDEESTVAMVEKVVGKDHYQPPADQDKAPEEPADFLRWFIDNDRPATGSGPNGLADYAQQVGTYWDVRDRPNVHLFHYQDMWNDLDSEMRRVAAALGVAIDEKTWPDYVDAATLKSMRGRAAKAAPDAHLPIWKSPEEFFHSGGTREWTQLLTPADLEHFDARLRELSGDSYDWIMRGKAALPAGRA